MSKLIGVINPYYGNYRLESIVYELLHIMIIDVENATLYADDPEMRDFWALSDDAHIYTELRILVRDFNGWYANMLESGYDNPNEYLSIKQTAYLI